MFQNYDMSRHGIFSGKSKSNPQNLHPRDSFKLRFQVRQTNKKPVLWFGIKFVNWTLIFFCLTLLPGWDVLLTAGLNGNARLVEAGLVWLGEPCRVSGASILSGQGGITVDPDCSALECIAFYCAAVLAFPAAFRRKTPGLLIGVVSILTVNLVRIASLAWTQVHCPAFFDSLHERIWPSVLIGLTLLVCLGWVQWAIPNHEPRSV